MVATNQSCLLVRTLLHFAGFHRQPLLGLLRGLLYLEVCESCSASSIELKIITFGKLLLFFVFNLASFFSKNRKSFLCPALSVPKSHSISGHRPRKNSTRTTLLRARRFLLQRLELLVSIGVHTSSAVVRPANTCMETSLETTQSSFLSSRISILPSLPHSTYPALVYPKHTAPVYQNFLHLPNSLMVSRKRGSCFEPVTTTSG